MTQSRQPRAFILDADDKAQRIKTPRQASIAFASEPADAQPPTILAPPPPPMRTAPWASVLISALTGLFLVWAGLAAAGLIEEAYRRTAALGWLASGLAGLAAFATLAIAFREIWGLIRLNRIEHIQSDAAQALAAGDRAAARRATDGVLALHRGRLDSQWGLAHVSSHASDIMDESDRLRLTERYLIAPRDEDAHRIIARAARRVTLITTVTPVATLDIAFVAVQNLRMVRELANLYGGRPSMLATMRLVRMVMAHLAVTGGLALSDSLLQHIVGKGLIGRLSSRFGEGAVNGILTARIGLAARDVCRPIPQDASAKETLGGLLRELVSLDREAKP